MEAEIIVPDEVPVMTLPNVAFFPQAMLPLHIFEPRYRHMLRDVLASLGIIRACQKNDNGTSNLLLQGLCRAEIDSIISDEPYRRIRIRALTSEPGASLDENERLRAELARLIKIKLKLAATQASDLTRFLKTVADPEAFVDIAAFSLCENPALKQKLLETLDVHRRFQLFNRELRRDIEQIKLRRKLQGGLADEHIADN